MCRERYIFLLNTALIYNELQLLMCGDESAERLTHEVACELGYVTSDGVQASFLSGHEDHTLHYKVNVRCKTEPKTRLLPLVLTKNMASF